MSESFTDPNRAKQSEAAHHWSDAEVPDEPQISMRGARDYIDLLRARANDDSRMDQSERQARLSAVDRVATGLAVAEKDGLDMTDALARQASQLDRAFALYGDNDKLRPAYEAQQQVLQDLTLANVAPDKAAAEVAAWRATISEADQATRAEEARRKILDTPLPPLNRSRGQESAASQGMSKEELEAGREWVKQVFSRRQAEAADTAGSESVPGDPPGGG